MDNISRIFESKNIEELHGYLKNNATKPLNENNSYLEQIPNLIKSLYEKEITATTSGLKQLTIKKQAAESIFYCYQMAVGNQEIKDKSLETGKVLNLDLSQIEESGLDFVPPVSGKLKDKIEYNKAAIILNGQMEKKSLEDYVKTLKTLDSPQKDLQKNISGYESILTLDYPKLSDKEIDDYQKVLISHAKLLGVPLSDAQLEFQEPFAVFGIDKDLSLKANYKSENQNPDVTEREFFSKLIRVDLLSEYKRISTIYRNLTLNLQTHGQLNKAESSTYKMIENKKKELENILGNLIFKEIPSVESLERTRAVLLAQNDDAKFLTLSHDQMSGQSPWYFSSDLKMLKEYYNQIENKADNLKLAANEMTGEPIHSILFLKKPFRKQEINEILKRYQGKPKELIEEAFNWQTYQTQIGFIFSEKDLGNTAAKLDSFFLRGSLPDFD